MIILITGDGISTDCGDIFIPQLKRAIESKKYWLHVLGLPGYDESLFSLLGLPHHSVQCEKLSECLSQLISG